ncbi:sugar ABC transporter permease [Thermus oshimai]|jgi:multiple sugar transport system permease protein|nr:sugar ABC transporter permease [Thermus oshimai]
MRRTPWLQSPAAFLWLPLLLYTVWVIYPTFSTILLAFSDWDGVSPQWGWVGLGNFRRLFQDPAFYQALKNNLIWLVVFLAIPTSGGLFLAYLLNHPLPLDRFLKVSFYLPLVLSPTVIALVWAWIYHPQQGLLNSALATLLAFLRSLGLPVDPEAARSLGWLGDPKLALGAILAAACWRQVGYVMILYLAGLKTLDPEVVEAAQVDGATGWILFWRVIFPLLMPITTLIVVISTVDSFRSFDLVYILTRGGPFHSTEVLANYMYLAAFHDYQMGYAAAIAVVLMAITIVPIAFFLRYTVRREEG